MVPCGLAGVEMTSVERELGASAPPLPAVARAVAESFGTLFALSPELVEPHDLEAMLSAN
jgi:lipoate-protein ligase B